MIKTRLIDYLSTVF